jgi:hypothetical protein
MEELSFTAPEIQYFGRRFYPGSNYLKIESH